MRIFAAALCFGLCIVGGSRPASAQSLLVDNTSSGFSVLSGSWLTTSVSGQYGTDYRYSTCGVPAGQVRWSTAVSAPGAYNVFVWYRNGNDRPPNVHYTVQHALGATDVFLDQRVNGSQWVRLGQFDFNAGAASVTLTADGQAGTTIIADGVRFVATGVTPTAAEVRACWLTQYQYLGKSEAQLRAIAQNIRSGGMNTVYVALYSGATVYWPSKAYLAAGGSWGSSSVDYAAYLTDVFHSEGLRVGAWFEYGMALGLSSQPIATAHPDWLARDQSGSAITGENGGFVFLSPGHTQAMAMLVSMARELAENYDFDDIQLDRIRWGKLSTGREYGYEAATSSLYQAQFGSAPPTNVNNSQWVSFRESLINSQVQQCYNAIKAANPRILVTSAPTGSYGIAQHMQRWSAWVTGGYIDLVMPQMYMTSLSSFQTELNTQRAQVSSAYWPKLGVGYRAQDDTDWTLVRDQLNYARGLGHVHGCLWVYHQYTAQIAIQDEIDNLPQAGQPWAVAAYNPFTTDCRKQIIIDNRDGSPKYFESGAWINSAQSDFFRFDSRVVDGAAPASVTFNAALPQTASYDVYEWHAASSNRNPAAQYVIRAATGDVTVAVDQRVAGGRWNLLGRYRYFAGGSTAVVTLSNAGTTGGVFTSADAIKLVLAAPVFGDANGDCDLSTADVAGAMNCMTGPGVSATAACTIQDFDGDGDVDMADFMALQFSLGNP